jgi:hypothetical protein
MRLSAVGALALLGACTAVPGPALAADDPMITQAPVISGTAQVGQTLAAVEGAWVGTEPITATYQWLRCSALRPADCVAISGATGTTYLAVPEDEGHPLRVALTVTNAYGDDSARSKPTSPVAAAPAPTPAPEPQPPPDPEPTPTPTPYPTPTPDPGPAPAPASAPAPGAPDAEAAATAAPSPTASVLVTSIQPQLLDPFPVVRFRGYVTSFGARITLLTIRTRRGTRITTTCSGFACPPAAERWAAPEGITRVRRFERFLPMGVRITITVTKKGWIGKHTLIVIRRNRPPLRRDRCLYPALALPVPCPVS